MLARRLPLTLSVVPLAAGVVAGLLAVSCSSSDTTRDEPISQSESHARITVALIPYESGYQLTGQVRFLRYRDVDAELVDLLVGAQPSPRVLDVCEIATPQAVEAALGSLNHNAFITHLDAGDLRVSLAGQATETLSPRHVPPLFPYVGGIEYEELTLLDPLEVPPDADLSVMAFGGRHIGGFDVVATLPAVAANVWATMSPANGGAGTVAIGWDPPVTAGPDEVIITITEGIGGAQIRCRASDIGQFIVPASVWQQVPDLHPNAAEIWVDRLRRAPFTAPGIDWGELEVVVRYVVTTSAP